MRWLREFGSGIDFLIFIKESLFISYYMSRLYFLLLLFMIHRYRLIFLGYWAIGLFYHSFLERIFFPTF
jgi:hypothetical protein